MCFSVKNIDMTLIQKLVTNASAEMVRSSFLQGQQGALVLTASLDANRGRKAVHGSHPGSDMYEISFPLYVFTV